MTLTRRELMQLIALASLGGAGCARPPRTPLAHPSGEQWVHGVYEMHARHYHDVQLGAETSSHGAYRILAQKGVSALDGLQAREAPFFIRVQAENRFEVERTIPERLTFTAEMTAAERQSATEAWKLAREHIHTDYFEIHRLNFALTTLLAQLVSIHSAMEQAETEQFKIVRELAELRGGAPTPYQLPAKVQRGDYQEVMLLLLARLEDDRRRLAVIEASIAAVGLLSRSTDAGSGSLAANIHKVMLAVIRDAEATKPRPAEFPKQPATRKELLATARDLAAEIEASPEYLTWKRNEEQKAIDQAGVLFAAIDSVTHLPTSALFRTVVGIWRGDGDYLNYLKAVATIVPGGGELAKTVGRGVEMSERVRRVTRRVRSGSTEALMEEAGALLNTRTRFGRERLGRQIALLSDQRELGEVSEAIATTELVTQAMPAVPVAAERP